MKNLAVEGGRPSLNVYRPSNPEKEVSCKLDLKYGKYRLDIKGEESCSVTDFYECLNYLINYSNKDKGIPISLSINTDLPAPQKSVLEGIVSLHNQKCFSAGLTRKLIHPH